MSEKKKSDAKGINRQDFLNLGVITEEVFIQELEKSVFVKVMNGKERRLFQGRMAADTKGEDDTPHSMIPTLIAITTLSANGNLIFNMDDLEVIDSFPTTITSKIFAVSARINGLTQKSIDESVKN